MYAEGVNHVKFCSLGLTLWMIPRLLPISFTDIVIARVPARQTTYVASGLIEGAQYTFGVVAEDTAGNRSPQLSLTLQTRDQSPPIWTDNAVLRAVDVTETHATLTWPEAQTMRRRSLRVILDDRIALETAATTAQLQIFRRSPRIAPKSSPSMALIIHRFETLIQFTTIDKTPPNLLPVRLWSFMMPAPAKSRYLGRQPSITVRSLVMKCP